MSELGEEDWKLIRELQADSRVPLTVLSRRLGVPRVTLLDRMNRLRRDGVIRRFTVVIDPEKSGQPTTAFVHVFLSRSRVDVEGVVRVLTDLPGVVEIHNVAGEPDLVLKVRGPGLKEVGQNIVNRIRAIPGVGATTTIPCFVSFKEEY
jgi:DNA-binding Lrp family transcriptional regulator